MSNPDEPKHHNRRMPVILGVCGIFFVAFGIIVQMGIIPLEQGDGMLNIIVGLVIIAAVPFMWTKRNGQK